MNTSAVEIRPKCRICRQLMVIVEAAPYADCIVCGGRLVYGFRKHWHCDCGTWAHYPGSCEPPKRAA